MLYAAFCSEIKNGVLNMYAVLKTGGKQYKVTAGDIIYVEKLDVEAGSELNLTDVVAISGENGLKVGTPTVEGASVTVKVIKNDKAKKITVFTYRAKKNSKRKMGHRQPYSKLEVVSING